MSLRSRGVALAVADSGLLFTGTGVCSGGWNGLVAVLAAAVVLGWPLVWLQLPCCCEAAVVASWCPQICTIPLDTAKVRLQLQKKVVAGDAMSLPKYKGLLGTVGTIAREEGMASLWKGIVPGLHRQFLFGGLRIGLYEPLKTSTWGKNHVGDVSLSKKIFAALTTGIAIANPTDLVKVRLQAEGKLPQGVPRRYSGALNAYSTIVRQEGVAKLWTGLGPNVARNAIINAAELASYDQVKEVLQHLLSFLFSYHLLSLISFGFFFF
ncbi:hypothetical protein ACS0TY_023614 [Phlomoides rotata]